MSDTAIIAGIVNRRLTAEQAYRHVRDTYPSLSIIGFRDLVRAIKPTEEYGTTHVCVVNTYIWAIHEVDRYQRRGKLVETISIIEVRHE